MSSLPPPPGQPPSEPSWPSYPSPGGAGPAPAPGYGPPPSFPAGGYGAPASPPGGIPPGFQPYGTQGNARASFGQRLGALIVDAIVNLVILAPFLVGLYFLLDKALENCFTITKANGDKKLECPDGALQVGPLVAAIVIGAIGLILVVYLNCRWVGRSQTPGQKALNIRVVDANSGQPIGMGRAFGRYLFRSLVSGSFCLLGYLWMLWDPNKQTWHDKVTNAVVIQT